MISKELQKLNESLSWDEMDRYLSGSGYVVTYEAVDDNGIVWQKQVWDFGQDFEELISIERA